jgi:chromosome segregation ATPase
MKQQTQLAVNVKQGMPAQWRNQAQVSMGTQRATAALSKQGLGNSQIEELLGAMPEGTIAGYNQATMKANKISGRKYGKTFDELNKKQKNKVMDKGNFSEEERKLLYIFKFSKAGIQAMQSASYEASAAAIKTQKDALDTTAAFKGMGINPEIAEKLTEMGVSANMSKAKINGLVASLEQLKQAEWNNMSVFDKTADLLDTQQGILDIKRQIAETTEIQPLQDEIDALQEKNNVLDRSIELKNRELEAIDESISKYEEQKEKINESFDIQIKALDEIEAANDRIFRIQQAQLGIANALSRGDVAGAAGAMQQLQQDLASENQKSTRDALELSRTNALKAIDAQINVLKDQRKGIEKEIKTLQDQQRANADAIYGKQTAINAKVKQLNDTYNNQQLKLASLNNELARMEAHWIEINRLAKNDPSTQNVPGVDSGTGTGAGSSTPPTSSTTPPALTGDTKLAYDRLTLSQNALNSGNYAASRNYYNAAQPYVNSAKDAGLRDWFNRINGSLTALGFASGGFVPGLGMTDKIPAMLTPGEFVVRKPVAQRFGAELAALNGNVFPRMNGAASLAAKGAGGNEIEYNYTINVNVAGTDASADDIANTVLGKIQSAQDRNIRSYKF